MDGPLALWNDKDELYHELILNFCRHFFCSRKYLGIASLLFQITMLKRGEKLKISVEDRCGNMYITNFSPKNSTLVWRERGLAYRLCICKSMCTLARLISAKTGNGVLGWFPFGEMSGQLVKDWHLRRMLNVGQSNS